MGAISMFYMFSRLFFTVCYYQTKKKLDQCRVQVCWMLMLLYTINVAVNTVDWSISLVKFCLGPVRKAVHFL